MRTELHELEDAMLTDLSETQIEREKISTQVANALMSGLGPLFGLVLPLTPFLFEGTALSLLQATVLSVAVLFAFGAYMASISCQQ